MQIPKQKETFHHSFWKKILHFIMQIDTDIRNVHFNPDNVSFLICHLIRSKWTNYLNYLPNANASYQRFLYKCFKDEGELVLNPKVFFPS